MAVGVSRRTSRRARTQVALSSTGKGLFCDQGSSGQHDRELCGLVATANRHDSTADGTIVPSLLDYLRVLGRWKLVFILIVLLVPATAVAVSLVQEPTYQASSEVLLRTQAPEGSVAAPYVDPQRVAQTRARLARIPDVVDDVLNEVPNTGLDRTEFLESSTVSTTLGSDILTFSVESSDPRVAMQLATAYAQSFAEYEQEHESELISAEVVSVTGPPITRPLTSTGPSDSYS